MLEIIQGVFQNSGLAGLWLWANQWLALDVRQLIFVAASPVFVGATLWEYRKIRHDPIRMNRAEALRNFMLGAGYQATELLFAGVIAFPVYAFVYHYRLLDLQLTWWTAIFTFVGVELCFYWMHRTSHRVRWFWAAHVVHHSSERMNFSTAMRQNATNIFNGSWLFYIPLIWLGLNPVWVGIVFALSLVYQFFIHTTLIGTLPAWVEWLFNTPSHHRVHHGRNRGYIDRNYGGILIVWDRFFGTFINENAQDPPKYGITRPVHSNNILWLWTHEYVDLFRDLAQPGPIFKRIKHLWMPPEWKRKVDS